MMPDNSTTVSTQPDTAAPGRVSELVRQFTALWWQSASDPPALGRSYTAEEQHLREKQLDHFQSMVKAEGSGAPRTAAQRQAAKERILSAFRAFAGSALDFSEEHLSALLDHGFPEAGQEFAQAARRFDPAIRGSDIFQAMRNVWTMNGIQALLGLPVRLTPAMFAYSMLYPYTDNYLDDPAVPPADKRAFNERLAARLAGEQVPANNPREAGMDELVGMVEGDFPRARFPQVYASLLAIHRAQCRSIELLQGNASPYELDVLGISLDKGGTSVLADGYLVAGTLTRAQAEYFFGWGAFVQFLDDVQDVEEDARDGLATVFSVTAGRWLLDKVTNRAFDFGRQVVERLACFDVPGAEPMKQMMRSTVFRMMVEAVGRAARFYTPPYVQAMETHSPFRFSFLGQRRGQLLGQSAPFVALLEAFARVDSRP